MSRKNGAALINGKRHNTFDYLDSILDSALEKYRGEMTGKDRTETYIGEDNFGSHRIEPIESSNTEKTYQLVFEDHQGNYHTREFTAELRDSSKHHGPRKIVFDLEEKPDSSIKWLNLMKFLNREVKEEVRDYNLNKERYNLSRAEKTNEIEFQL